MTSSGLDGDGCSSARAGERVRSARHERGWSVRELAARLRVSPATVSAIENGRTGVTVERLGRLAQTLGVSAADLLCGSSARGAANQRGKQEEPASDAPGSIAAEPAASHWREFPRLDIDAVLASALRCFVATGYHGASMRAIADGAGISVAGVYHHYPSKQQLLVRILDLTMDELDWRLRAARDSAEGERGPLARLAALVEALALFHILRRDLAFIGASEMRSLEPAQRRRIARRRTAVQHVLDAEIGAAIGADLATTAMPLATGRAIATMCTSLPQWFNDSGPTRPEQIAREYAELALRMIGAR